MVKARAINKSPTTALTKILFPAGSPMNNDTGIKAAAIPNPIAIRVIIPDRILHPVRLEPRAREIAPAQTM